MKVSPSSLTIEYRSALLLWLKRRATFLVVAAGVPSIVLVTTIFIFLTANAVLWWAEYSSWVTVFAAMAIIYQIMNDYDGYQQPLGFVMKVLSWWSGLSGIGILLFQTFIFLTETDFYTILSRLFGS